MINGTMVNGAMVNAIDDHVLSPTANDQRPTTT